MARAHLELLRLRVQHQPDVDRVLDLGMQELKTKLSSEQQVKLDGLHAQFQQRWRMTVSMSGRRRMPGTEGIAAMAESVRFSDALETMDDRALRSLPIGRGNLRHDDPVR